MLEILPGILEIDFAGVKDKLTRLAGIVQFAQLDVTDGIFVGSESWHSPRDLANLDTDIRLDLHLMVDRPEKWIPEWLNQSIFRITFHYEATYDVRRTARLIRASGMEAGLALKLETPLDVVRDVKEEIDMVLLMSIEPGVQGREFDPRAVDRVKEFKNKYSGIKIGVDGGINNLTAQATVHAGADMLVSGSYLFGQDDIKEAIESLRHQE